MFVVTHFVSPNVSFCFYINFGPINHKDKVFLIPFVTGVTLWGIHDLNIKESPGEEISEISLNLPP